MSSSRFRSHAADLRHLRALYRYQSAVDRLAALQKPVPAKPAAKPRKAPDGR